jgi:2-polyprenyl-3-methyl-5-hydroxy-6-metoxy-1,4-benzoquinol methylase
VNDENEGFNLFPDRYIDAIEENPEDNYFSPVLAEILDSIDDPRSVCDVGCGNGVFSISIKRRLGCRQIGVDGSEHSVARAREIAFDEAHHVADLCSEYLPLADDSMDLVFCQDVLEHLLEPSFLVGDWLE